MNLPKHAQVVIIGAVIAGCSTAYHLTELGWQDVVLIDRKTISGLCLQIDGIHSI